MIFPQALVLKLFVSIVFSIALLSMFSCAHKPLGTGAKDNCSPVLRAAVDVGSGSTKLLIAQVDPCTQRIVEILLEDQRKLPYREELEACSSGEGLCLTGRVQERGWTLMSEWAQVFAEQGVEEVRGVATEALRQARNGEEFITRLNREFPLQLKLIDQEQEALLGFQAAVLGRQVRMDRGVSDLKKRVVWDIGGGSQQMSRWEGGGKWNVLKSDLGSVAFKNHVIQSIQGRNENRSPNPLSKNEVEKGIQYARHRARDLASPQWRRFLARSSTEVLGVGGVHRFSLPGQLRQHPELNFSGDLYTAKQLAQAIELRHGLRDEQIGGEYFETEITNLILVYAWMTEMGIRRVVPVPADLNLALLSLSPKDWLKIRHISQD